MMSLQFFDEIVFAADLTLDQNFRAVSLDMVMELGSGHMLELGSIADITSELGAVELSEGLSEDLTEQVSK